MPNGRFPVFFGMQNTLLADDVADAEIRAARRRRDRAAR
jgi:hypothetical protein